jgi:uncharacterized protein
MKHVTRRSATLLGLLALGAAGCFSGLGGGTSPSPRLYVLTPVVELDTATPVSAPRLGTIGVGPVSVPGYLDRPQLVTRPSLDNIEIHEFDQWGEPLQAGISRVVGVNLSRLLPGSHVMSFPWRTTERIAYQLVLNVVQLDGPPSGDVVVDVRWRILDAAGKELTARVSRLTEPSGGGGVSGAPPVMSRALGALSREMAQVLAGLPR